ncbi:MAG: twin-arginine translocation signal domain-containing protein [Actinomycetia bacterium]|nr:twin-arginine translocation signal domain-containing protein [Actinomycetes bacterium]
MPGDRVVEDGGLSRRNLLRGAAAAGVGAAVWASPSAAGLVGTPAYALGCSTLTFDGVNALFAFDGSGVDPADGVSNPIIIDGRLVWVSVHSEVITTMPGVTLYTEFVDIRLPNEDCELDDTSALTLPGGQPFFQIPQGQWVDQGNSLFRYTVGFFSVPTGSNCVGDPAAIGPDPWSFFLPHCSASATHPLIGGVWVGEITCCGPGII